MGTLDRFLAGDFPITIAIYVALWLWASRNRSTIQELIHDPHPLGRWLGRVTVASLFLFPLWVALADNWRQLLAYGMDERSRWMSDPFWTPPTPELLRWVSLGMALIISGGLAILYARRRGGIGLALLLLVGATGYFYFLNTIRTRADVLLRMATEGHLAAAHPVDLGFTLFWAGGLYFFIASLVFALLAIVFAVAAIPLRLVFMVVERREAEREAEEAAIFAVYRDRAVAGGLPGPVGGALPPEDASGGQQKRSG